MTIELIRLVQRRKLTAIAAYKQALAMGSNAFKALCQEDPDLPRTEIPLDEYAELTLDYLRQLSVQEHESAQADRWNRLGVYAGKVNPVKLIETGTNAGIVYTDWLHTRYFRVGITSTSRRRTISSPQTFPDEFVLRRQDTAVLFTLVEAFDPGGVHVAYLLFSTPGENLLEWRHSARDDLPIVYDADNPPSRFELEHTTARHSFPSVKNLQTDALFGAVPTQYTYQLHQSWLTLIPAHPSRSKVLSALQSGRDALLKAGLGAVGGSGGSVLGGAVGGALGKVIGQAVGAAVAKLLSDEGIDESLTVQLSTTVHQQHSSEQIPIVPTGESALDQELGTGPELWAHQPGSLHTLTLHESVGHAMVRTREATGRGSIASTWDEDVRIDISANVRYLVRRTFAETA